MGIMMHLHSPSTLKVLPQELIERREKFMMGLIMRRLKPARIEGMDTLKVLPQELIERREKFLTVLQGMIMNTMKVLPKEPMIGRREEFMIMIMKRLKPAHIEREKFLTSLQGMVLHQGAVL